MKKFPYVSYAGPKKYIFFRAYKSDYKEASLFLRTLVEKDKVRVFFDAAKAADEHYPDEIAGGILNSEIAVFVISSEACEDLDFRNSINYALSIKKKVICLKKGDFEYGHGLDMQLANILTVHSYEELRSLLFNDYLNEEFKGPEQKRIVEDQSKKRLVFLLSLAILVILLAGGNYAVKRIRYYNSGEYILGKLDSNLDYFDFTGSGFEYEDLVYLKDKSIRKLNLADMDLKKVDLIVDLDIEELDLSGNPNVDTLFPLVKSESLKKITVSQDMYIYLEDLYNSSDIQIVISR